MIRHAYGFVPLANGPLKREPPKGRAGHERLDSKLHSGVLRCVLEVKRPLCFKAHFRELQKAGEPAYLPGSSIKGAIRNAAEMLGAGCGMYFKDGESWPKLGPLTPCRDGCACLVCRVFGTVEQRQKGRGGDAVDEAEMFTWQGKARFHDTEAVRTQWLEIPSGSARWQSHSPLHRAFYYLDNVPAGWKVYRHAETVVGATPEYREGAWCVGEGVRFPFEVEYENLTGEELAVLRFALELRHDCEKHQIHTLCHKMGYGKGIGLGSCEIRITGAVRSDPGRYLAVVTPVPAFSECDIHRYLDGDGFRAMRDSLDWAKRAERIEFPPKRWFDDWPTKTIAEFESEKNAEESARSPAGQTLGERWIKGEEEQPKPASGLAEGKKYNVRVTALKRNSAECETTEEPHFRGKIANPLSWVRIGTVCRVRIDKVDAGKGEFQASKPEAV